MSWDWIERAAWLLLAARLGYQAFKAWRTDSDVAESFSEGILGFVCMLFALQDPTGGIGSAILAGILTTAAVTPERVYFKLLGRKPREIAPEAKENDKQLTD